MSKKILTLFVLTLCVGLFLFPTTAFAAENTDTTPPTLTAKLTGETLHVEAADNIGVEAIFIDGNRINYRVDGTVDIILKDYAGTGQTVKIYAVDFTGNKSKTTELANPYYTAPTQTTTTPSTTTAPVQTTPNPEPEPTASALPTESNPFTPGGTGTVMDNATDGDGKEFFTITTADENVFYLIVDRQRDNENVYLLNVVTEDDLMALAEKSSGSGQSAVPEPTPTPTPVPTEPDPEPEPVEPENSSNTSTILLILLAVLGVGGAGYYIKIVKPKKDALPDDEDEYDDSDYGEDFEDYEDDYGFDDSGDADKSEE